MIFNHLTFDTKLKKGLQWITIAEYHFLRKYLMNHRMHQRKGGGVSTEIFSHTKKESIEAVSLPSVS